MPSVLSFFGALERGTRPVDPHVAVALDRRWAELPARVRTDAQLLGRRFTGCEGTHGVFPRCDLACTPCYHSREANRVRTDGAHTVAEVERQMAYLSAVRGPWAHAQLIGGEVTLLSPEDHAAALQAMRRHGRHPMSMSHGDFDYGYLERLAVDAEGRRRFRRIAFAGHFDSLMLGRRGIPRPRSEAELHLYRRQFVAMFQRLRREHGVRSVLAHNMTVAPRNLAEVADVVAACLDMGFRILSFQPAAALGNPARWKEDYRAVGIDEVWRELEIGAGARLAWRGLQVGDPRCNRTAYGLRVGRRWFPVVDDRDPRDLRVRDAYLDTFRGIDLGGTQPLTALRVARALLARPRGLALAGGWALRFIRRAGVIPLLRHGARPLTFVVHAFMDGETVRAAWAATSAGRTAEDPEVRAAQERLAACSYAMAHPDDERLVPACVQHGVLDPEENRVLAGRLPLHTGVNRRAAAAVEGADALSGDTRRAQLRSDRRRL
jgi:hypothetical protein